MSRTKVIKKNKPKITKDVKSNNTIKSAAVSIDIGEKKIRIIKTNKSGLIVKSGEAVLPKSLSSVPDNAFIYAVANGIKSAAKKAGLRGSKNCVVVVGGSHTIVRRFLWPEMTAEGLQLNAETEIALYLPSAPEDYNINCRVLKKVSSNEQETPVKLLEVLVAAMPKDISEKLMTAAKKAGFTPTRIDIRENARDKLFQTPSICVSARKPIPEFEDMIVTPKTFDPNKSFTVLDISDDLMNMTVFIDGIFYANRYFGELAKEDGILAAEVSSIIDYIQYRERGSEIKSIVIFGDDEKMPELSQMLAESLHVAIYYPQKIISTDFFLHKGKSAEIRLFIDSLGAALPPLEKDSSDLDLKPKKNNENLLSKVILPLLITIIVLVVTIGTGIYVPHRIASNLEAENRILDEELARYTITQADIEMVTDEIQTMEETIEEIESFYKKYPQASQVLRDIYASLPGSARIRGISINSGHIRVTGTDASLNNIGNFVVDLRKNEIFSNISVQTALPSNSDESTSVNFEITLTLNGLNK